MSYRRRPGIPSHGIAGWFAGGATVPGVALIDTLPLVSQMDTVLVVRQVGLALATGVEMPATTTELTVSTGALTWSVVATVRCPADRSIVFSVSPPETSLTSNIPLNLLLRFVIQT
jgi:hypothetical protein